MSSFIHFRRARRSSASSGYMELLSTLANDLDHMLSVLCTTPPPPYDRLTDNELHTSSILLLNTYHTSQTEHIYYKLLVMSDFRENFDALVYPNGSRYAGMARIKTLLKPFKGCAVYLGNFIDPSKERRPEIAYRMKHLFAILKQLAPNVLVPARGEYTYGKSVAEQFHKNFFERIPPSNVANIPGNALNLSKSCPPLFGYLHVSLRQTKTSFEIKDLVSTVDGLAEKNKRGISLAMGCAGYREGMRLARESRHLRVVLSGCTEEGDESRRESEFKVVKNANGEDVLFMYVKSGTTEIGWISLTIEDRNIINYNETFIQVGSKVQPEKQIEELLNNYGQFTNTTTIRSPEVVPPTTTTENTRTTAAISKTSKRMKIPNTTSSPGFSGRISTFKPTPLGKAMVFLNGECYKSECNYGNLVTDAFIQYKSNTYEGKNWTDTPIAIIAGGMINNSINATARKGVIYLHDIENSILDDKLVTIQMQGMDLRRALDYGFHFIRRLGAKKFLQVSGLRIMYDPFKPLGRKLVSVKVRCECISPSYSLLMRPEMYNVITTKGLCEGNFGHINVNHSEIVKEENITAVEAIASYIKELKYVYASNSDRIMVASRITIRSASVRAKDVCSWLVTFPTFAVVYFLIDLRW